MKAMAYRLGVFGFCAAGGLFVGSCSRLVDTRAEFERFHRAEPIDGLSQLDVEVDYSVGMFELRPEADGNLYSIDLDYDRIHFEPKTSMERSDSSGSLRFELESQGTGFGSNTFENDLVMALSDQVAVDLELSMGVADSYIDLTGLETRTLRFNGGVGRAEIVFHQPGENAMDRMDVSSGVGDIHILHIGNARLRDLRFAGGVGRAELDFTGNWGEWVTTADISVGVGKLDLSIPSDLPVEINAGESFLSSIRAPSFARQGSRYTRNVSGATPPQLILRIDSGVGGVDVDLR